MVPAGFSRSSLTAASSASISSNRGPTRAEQALAGLRRRHAARGAGEKSNAKPRFQLTDGVAQRRLRDAKLGRRSCETAFSRATARRPAGRPNCRAALSSPAYNSMQIIAASRHRRNGCLDCAKSAAADGNPAGVKRGKQWRSSETARSRPARDRRTISPVRSGSIRCSRRPIRRGFAGASVTFEPGARTAWHTHPLGQTLIVTSGLGWARRWGGPIEEIRPGDVIWFPPGEKHWHGASPTTAMTHIAIQEALNGKVVDWLEQGQRRAISALIVR